MTPDYRETVEKLREVIRHANTGAALTGWHIERIEEAASALDAQGETTGERLESAVRAFLKAVPPPKPGPAVGPNEWVRVPHGMLWKLEQALPAAPPLALSSEQGNSDPEPSSAWRPIESAPRDGTHFLACNASPAYGEYRTFNQQPPAVVHWWGNPGEEGFYLSVTEQEAERPFRATHWMPLSVPPIAEPTDKEVEDAIDHLATEAVPGREHEVQHLADRLKAALREPSSEASAPQKDETKAICYRCQMRLPERLTSAAVNPRAGVEALCAVCDPSVPRDDPRRLEVVALRKARLRKTVVQPVAECGELDTLVDQYKHVADNDGEHRIKDLVWLVNELIYEREHPAGEPREPHAALLKEIEGVIAEDGFSGGPDKRKSTGKLEAWCPECSSYREEGHDEDCRWLRDHKLLRRCKAAILGSPTEGEQG